MSLSNLSLVAVTCIILLDTKYINLHQCDFDACEIRDLVKSIEQRPAQI